jgi:hypothetical protein
MIEEFVREMSADERASLQRALQPQPPSRWHSDVSRDAWVLGGITILVLVVAVAAGATNVGGIVAVLALAAFVIGRLLVKETVKKARRRKFFEVYDARRSRETARVLEDGRVTVRRVRAVAVVEIEPLEDEGTGYVFDLGDGRVLFFKEGFFPDDEEAPWPNTDFEIVRAAADGRLLGVRGHGTALPPLRVVPHDDVDPEKGWDEREEVLQMSVDEALSTILRAR